MLRKVVGALALVAVGLTVLNLATGTKGPEVAPADVRQGSRTGKATLSETATACLNAETIAASFLAIGAGDGNKSIRLISGDDCAKLPAGQMVTLTGRWTELSIGPAKSDLMRFVEYTLSNGAVVWGLEVSVAP